MKEIEKMDFSELWDYLNTERPEEFRKIRKVFETEFGIKDPALRHKKRKMQFIPVERRFITEFYRAFFDNKKINADTLFPNNPERFVNDFYNDLLKKQQAV